MLNSINQRFRRFRDQSLERDALAARARSDAVFIGITGSSAKSTTTDLLAHVLAAHGSVRKQVNFNDPRAILKAIAQSRRGSEFVVAEVAIGSAYKIAPIAKVFQPDVAVVTMVAIEHKPAFHTLEEIAAEKGELLAALRPGGFAVLNSDDPNVAAMAGNTSERVVTFGRSEKSDYRATGVRAAYPQRLRLTVDWAGKSLPLNTNFVGEHFWLPTLAAVATAIELEVPPDLVAERVAAFEPLLERCGVVSVPNGPEFILDTYKAPWHSLELAFEMLAAASAPRKRIVLGHLSDFPGSSKQRYRDAYRLARAVADQVIFVGTHSHRSKASQQDRDEGRLVAFATPKEVADYVRATSIPGEVILLKGSGDLHLERIALLWKSEIRCWIDACGNGSTCLTCGRFADPYEWHKGRRKRGRIKRFLRARAAAVTRRLTVASQIDGVR
jgi:UDP-N-acetylmuramoyl-tripeptide--D-alanyl-D-alanine ligase